MGLLSRIFAPRAEVIATSQELDLLLRMGSAGPTAAGIAVTPEAAMRATAVFACVRILAESVAQLPLILYRRARDGRKERATEHPLYQVTRRRPNQWMTSYEWREMMQGHLSLRGNAYSFLVRLASQGGRVAEMLPIHPDRVQAEQDERWRLLYRVTMPDGVVREFGPDRILHLRGLSSDGVLGYSPVHLHREAIGYALAAEKHGAKLFSNGAAVGGVASHPNKLSDTAYDRLKKSIREDYSGSENAFKTLILEEGMTWQAVGLTSKDAQYLESRKFQKTEIATIFRIPPHMIADLERATFCLPASSEVFTDHGPKSIAAIEPDELVWSRGEDGRLALAPVLRVACTGSDPIITLRTTNRTLRLNARHRVLARRAYERPLRPGELGGRAMAGGGLARLDWRTEYVPAGELNAGDMIVALKGTPDSGNRRAPTRIASQPFMEFCGLFLGDGYMTKGHVSIARADDASYMDYYRSIIPNLFERYEGGNGRGDQSAVKRAPVTLAEGNRYTRFASVLAASELRKLGFGGTAHEKQAPGWIFGVADELKLAFLRGFLDADGSVDKQGRISFSSCNHGLLSGIRHLCLSVGIPVTNLYERSGKTKLPNGERTTFHQFYFSCSDPGSNWRIGSHTPIYLERLEQGKPFRRKGRAYPRYGGKDFNEPWGELSRVISIEVNESEPVYDLEVAHTHSFIADGVVVHNSNIEHQSLEFVKYTLDPWLRRWEERLTLDLLSDRDRAAGYFFEFLVEEFLRGDSKGRAEFYKIALGGTQNPGFMTPNEVRAKENLPPIADGDRLHAPKEASGDAQVSAKA